MKSFLFSVFCLFSLAANSQGAATLADMSGVWKGAFYQKNFLNPNDSDLVYKAVMTVEQHGDKIVGHCYIFWFDDEHYYSDWQLEGSYDGLNFTYAEKTMNDAVYKPGYTWCYKNVESFVVYNPELGRWMLSGSFNAKTDGFDCMPGKLIFFKEGDV